MTDAIDLLLGAGWSYERVTEFGQEAWRWEGPGGVAYYAWGRWANGPRVPDELCGLVAELARRKRKRDFADFLRGLLS